MTALQKHLMGLKTILAQPWRATPRATSVAFWGPHKGRVLLHPDPPRHWAKENFQKNQVALHWAPLRAKNSSTFCKGKSSIKGGTYLLFWPLYLQDFISCIKKIYRTKGALEGSGASLSWQHFKLALNVVPQTYSSPNSEKPVCLTAHLKQMCYNKITRVFPLSVKARQTDLPQHQHKTYHIAKPHPKFQNACPIVTEFSWKW